MTVLETPAMDLTKNDPDKEFTDLVAQLGEDAGAEAVVVIALVRKDAGGFTMKLRCSAVEGTELTYIEMATHVRDAAGELEKLDRELGEGIVS
jgi:hypothetical protein